MTSIITSTMHKTLKHFATESTEITEAATPGNFASQFTLCSLWQISSRFILDTDIRLYYIIEI